MEIFVHTLDSGSTEFTNHTEIGPLLRLPVTGEYIVLGEDLRTYQVRLVVHTPGVAAEVYAVESDAIERMINKMTTT